MKVLVIGAGAVGLSFAAALYVAGASVGLVARSRTAQAVWDGGILREGIFPHVAVPAGAVEVFDCVQDAGTGYDFLLISVKTTGNAEIAAGLAARRANLLSPQGYAVLMQNGYGNEQTFAGALPPEQILHGSFAIGFERTAPNVSRVTVFSKPTLIGRLQGGTPRQAQPLIDAIVKGGIPCSLTDEIDKTLWAKLLYNCALNPLSALLRCDYGGLMGRTEGGVLISRIIDELFAVMHAAGHVTFWDTADAYKREFFRDILPPTFSHRASTLQDMERNIPTEIDSLNGAVSRMGREYGVPTPCNDTIVSLVKMAEGLYDYTGAQAAKL